MPLVHRRSIALSLALVASACGSDHQRAHPPPHTKHTRVAVYASLPLHGPRAAQAAGILQGIRLAYAQAHGRAGRWHVRLFVRDNSSISGGGWDAIDTARNARTAASDLRAVYYIGELDSAASEVSGPILNVAGVPQVSPLSTYAGLTSSSGSLDPTGTPTFLRLAPSDSIQAGAQLDAAMGAGCTRVAIVHDNTLEGAGLALRLQARNSEFGVQIVDNESLASAEQDLGAYVSRLKSRKDRCLIFSGTSSPTAAAFLSSVSAAYPRLQRIIGSNGVCTASFTNAHTGGLTLGAQSHFRCTSPAGNLRSSLDGRDFLAAYAATYHATPDPVAVYGYEAMKLAIDTISGLGARGDDKDAVRRALFALRNRSSAIGVYGFRANGNTSAGSYGLYDVGSDGAPTFLQSLRP
jgi:branched-chain amino acid transport system substrate-binding protein